MNAQKKKQHFEIEGGHKLHGSISTNTSKNGSVGLLCAALLNKGKTTFHGISRIEEVYRIIEVLESIGVNIKWVGEHSLELIPPEKFDITQLDAESAIKTRSIIMLAGPLIHRMDSFYLPHAQGCKLGKRTVSAHIYSLEELGVKIEVLNDRYQLSHVALVPTEIIMYEPGDTATENILMAAALIPGKTNIKFASSNYMVQEVCFFLEKLGVKIDGIGTNSLTVHGVKKIDMNVEYTNSEDPIEAMTWITAAIVTDSELEIERAPIEFLQLELYKLQKMGLKYRIQNSYKSDNGRTLLADIVISPSKLIAAEDKIEAHPYPGINIDNLPFFGLIAAKATGKTLIHDWIYENRAEYFNELKHLGVDVELPDPHRAFITGPTSFTTATLSCPPALRPSVVIMLAMLAAKGVSTLNDVYMINRGYEDIAGRLNAIGAHVRCFEE